MSPSLTQRLDERLERAVAVFEAAPSASLLPPALEPLIETSYALADGDQRSLRALWSRVEGGVGRHPTVDAWLALLGLALVEGDEVGPALARVDACLGAAPPWTRLVVGAEAARLVWGSSGAAVAWRCASPLGAGIRAALPMSDVQRGSALLVTAVCTLIDLAAVNGAWNSCREIEALASSIWAAPEPFAARVALVAADAAISAGRYIEALNRIAALEPAARGDLRIHLQCVKLHALVAIGRGKDPATQQVLEALHEAERAPSDPEHALPAQDRQRLRLRVQQVIAGVRELAEIDERARGPAAGGGEDPTFSDKLRDLLERERKARGRKSAEARVRDLLPVLREVEDLVLSDGADADPSEWIRLRLLFCRVVVDLALNDAFYACESVLGEVIEEARDRRFLPLEMLALDQRAVLLRRKDPADWQGAALDSNAAARLAMELIALNADAAGDQEGFERSLLERLLPVLDRGIEMHAEGAERIARRFPVLLDECLGPLSERLREEETERGAWLRFGQLLHHFAEQAQALALEGARRAYSDGRMMARRFAVVPEEPRAVLVDDLMEKLRPEDGVLQYLLVTRYVLVFVYGRGFFDWSLSVVEGESAEQSLDALIEEELRVWTQGGDGSDQAEALGKLHRHILPDKIVAALRAASVRHLRVVPHGALYRVPFGRLLAARYPARDRLSLSLHPTGQLAADSAEARPLAPARRRSLGHVIGPEIEDGAETDRDRLAVPAISAEREARALRRGVGAVAPIAGVTAVDGVSLSLPEILRQLRGHSLLHFSCHGREGNALGTPASMVLGSDPGEGLTPRTIAGLGLDRCALVVLQSCSTGWMDHKRSHPVQGIPQAFVDAGARAVIAPLTKVPAALVGIFSEVFYRALRFLPAEVALHRTLAVLRRHGGLLVAGDPEARAKFVEYGSTMDTFEYRYTGQTGLLIGGWVARAVGQISFLLFERRLALRRWLEGRRRTKEETTRDQEETRCSVP